MPTRVRWPGSGSAVNGLTPFGLYDNDLKFQNDAPRAAQWAGIRLGYPITDVEMIDINFYACFEESINEYAAQVNQFNIRQNISLLQGQSTTVDFTQKNVQGTSLPFMVKLSQAYGTEVGVGGMVDWKLGHVQTHSGSQVYDLQEIWGNTVESGSRIEIRRVYHETPPSIARIYDPFSMTGMSYSNVLNEMGFAGYSPATQFLMTPIFEDLLRDQAIEFNDLVRKSAYSFELINNKLKVFPIPTFDMKVYFQYLVTKERDDQVLFNNQSSGSSSQTNTPVVSDYSNVQYNIIPYSNINEVGKQWIRKYFLAICKELLGAIRQKYQTIPIPGAEITLDGAELRSEAATEKEALITQLRENLEAATRKVQLENSTAEAEQLQTNLKLVPLLIYVG